MGLSGDCPICQTKSSLRLLHRFEDDPHYVVGCGVCSAQTIVPHPEREELKEYYLGYRTTRTPDEQMPLLIEKSIELFNGLSEHLSPPPDFRDVRYMEIGFGNGASILAAAQLGMQTFGFDLDPNNVSDVSRRGKSLGLDVRIEWGDANRAIEQGDVVDLIKASHVIEHLIDPVAFVNSISDVLSRNGYLFIECPNNSAFFFKIKNWLRKPFRRTDFYNSLRLKEHLWGFNRRSMAALLRARGFEIVFCRDYSFRHRYFQPENSLWYPSVASGVGLCFSEGQLYPLLKSSIPVFDRAASLAFSGGSGLALLARKRVACERGRFTSAAGFTEDETITCRRPDLKG